MVKLMLIMTGGGIGAGFRHLLFTSVQGPVGLNFPVGTLVVNLTGSLFVGTLWGLLETYNMASETRLFIFTGILGGFTTFSAFTRECTQLLKLGMWKEAFLYISMSNIFGIALVFFGFFIARKILLFFQP